MPKYDYRIIRCGEIRKLSEAGQEGWRVVPVGILPGSWFLLEKITKPPLQKVARKVR